MKIFLSIFFLIFLFSGCSNRNENAICSDCNVVIISLTNLRKNNLDIYGYQRHTTPNIDKFFDKSYVFKNAFAPASLTFTDSISLFYSIHPVKHGFMNRVDREKSSKKIENYLALPEVLQKNGYKTAAFVSDEDYTYENGLGKTFEYYFDKKFYKDYGIDFKPWQYNVGTKDIVGIATNWLKENYKKKFFLFVQAYDMHCPYTPDDKFKFEESRTYKSKIDFSNCYMTLDKVKKQKIGNEEYYELYDWHQFLNKVEQRPTLFSNNDIRQLKDLYDGELLQADNNLQPLFSMIDNLGIAKKTIFIFLSEHGDYLGENGYYMKAAVTGDGNLHNANLGFPFFLKLPNQNQKILKDQIIQTIDIAPSLLEMVGYKIPEHMQGKSFASVLNTNQEINDYAFSSTSRRRKFHDAGMFVSESLQNKKWKYNYYAHYGLDKKMESVEEKLFDLEKDKNELNDLSKINKDQVKLMSKESLKLKEYYSK